MCSCFLQNKWLGEEDKTINPMQVLAQSHLMITFKKYAFAWLRDLEKNFFSIHKKACERLSLAKGMITSAIVLSKVSMIKRLKPRCLYYWQVDSRYLEKWLKHNQKLHNNKIPFWSVSDFETFKNGSLVRIVKFSL